MRVVVMDEEMREPITVVEIPMSLMRKVERRELREIALQTPMNFDAWFTSLDRIPNVPESISIRVVYLRMEPIMTHRNGRTEVLHWVAVPNDPELALLLRAAFLPGQVTELRRREAQAWFQGAVAGLQS